jgi:hypothetical protein
MVLHLGLDGGEFIGQRLDVCKDHDALSVELHSANLEIVDFHRLDDIPKSRHFQAQPIASAPQRFIVIATAHAHFGVADSNFVETVGLVVAIGVMHGDPRVAFCPLFWVFPFSRSLFSSSQKLLD